jgi:hypothetical protein
LLGASVVDEVDGWGHVFAQPVDGAEVQNAMHILVNHQDGPIIEEIDDTANNVDHLFAQSEPELAPAVRPLASLVEGIMADDHLRPLILENMRANPAFQQLRNAYGPPVSRLPRAVQPLMITGNPAWGHPAHDPNPFKPLLELFARIGGLAFEAAAHLGNFIRSVARSVSEDINLLLCVFILIFLIAGSCTAFSRGKFVHDRLFSPK